MLSEPTNFGPMAFLRERAKRTPHN